MEETGYSFLKKRRQKKFILRLSALQLMNYEPWIPTWECTESRQITHEMIMEAAEDEIELKGTLKRLQKLVRVRKINQNNQEDGKNILISSTNSHMQDNFMVEDSPVISCIKLPKSQDKKQVKEPLKQNQNTDLTLDFAWNSLDRPYRPKWNYQVDYHPPWGNGYHTCRRAIPEYRVYGHDFTLPRSKDWDKYECCAHDKFPARFTRSATDMDLYDSKRSSSFGRFDAFRHHPSRTKAEDNVEINAAEGEAGDESSDSHLSKTSSTTGGISQKIRDISLTMKKKMGKKYSKALSEEMTDDGEKDCTHKDSDHESHPPIEKAFLHPSESMESLYSLNSGQSSSSGVTSGSDGSSNRDSLRLDEDVPYSGPFCGRAKVHTDFIPSPYDTDSLKLKKGDIIEIISKPPMGTWTGMLHNKVGCFKFIYVDVLTEEHFEPRKLRPHRRSKRPRPKTLQELLKRLELQEYESSLLLNGYQTLEDLKDLRENHLIELNILDPDHRARLLAAIEVLGDIENDLESGHHLSPQTTSETFKGDQLHTNECPRDSGCYVTTECSDTGKEDTEADNLPQITAEY
ncbi:SAM domain-containing protein SAMSN-1-like isoform X2 [Erpetoichthys calabaricus]|uniref:SAM domain-containing protein SAMSN-1-like isoform X2 n=1 Tax=Erpetoichthys calabaricus TaxID=27687 RepID=UPI00223448F5|nr:SAM domain-containing protein SAMSN-1-like isoform X2 [Erpetoichthys calabaricus]